MIRIYVLAQIMKNTDATPEPKNKRNEMIMHVEWSFFKIVHKRGSVVSLLRLKWQLDEIGHLKFGSQYFKINPNPHPSIVNCQVLLFRWMIYMFDRAYLF